MMSKNASTCLVDRIRCAVGWLGSDESGSEIGAVYGFFVFWELGQLFSGVKAVGDMGGYVLAMLQKGHDDGVDMVAYLRAK